MLLKYFFQITLFSFRCLFATIDALSYTPSFDRSVAPKFELDDCGRSVDVAIASSWLRHCLEERDIVRLLEPLLLVTLHHSTHSTLVTLYPGKPFLYSINFPGLMYLDSSNTQPRWSIGVIVRLSSCRLGFDFESGHTNDFNIGIRSFPARC